MWERIKDACTTTDEKPDEMPESTHHKLNAIIASLERQHASDEKTQQRLTALDTLHQARNDQLAEIERTAGRTGDEIASLRVGIQN